MTSPTDFFEKRIWTWGMACAWIMHRDYSRSAEALDAEPPKNLPIYYEIDEMSAHLRAERLLIDSLMAGEVTSTGLISNERRTIGAYEWIDAEEIPNVGVLGMGRRRRTLRVSYRMRNSAGDDISDLRLNREEILRCWPIPSLVRPAHRPRTIRDNAILAIQNMFPGGEYETLKRAALLTYVNDWLAKRSIDPISEDTLSRAVQEMTSAQK